VAIVDGKKSDKKKEVVDRGRIGICLVCWNSLGYLNQQQQINLIKMLKNLLTSMDGYGGSPAAAPTPLPGALI